MKKLKEVLAWFIIYSWMLLGAIVIGWIGVQFVGALIASWPFSGWLCGTAAALVGLLWAWGYLGLDKKLIERLNKRFP